MSPVFAPPTKRKTRTKAQRARIFIANDGRCALCRQLIRDGETWEIEHPDPAALGGSDDDAALTVVHVRCHRGKTRTDVARIAKRNRIIASGYAKPRSRLSHPTLKRKVDSTVVNRATGEPIGGRG